MNASLFAKGVPTDSGCILWGGYIRKDGYANVTRDGRSYLVHRLAYELAVGPIPDGMTLDHGCHTADLACAGGVTCVHRRCFNPEHLVVMEGAANSRLGVRSRLTHCANGHEFSEANTYRRPQGGRDCRTCGVERTRRYKARAAAA